ncbi:MAG: FxsA family protein [Pseudomonadota bacterium]
MWLLIAFIAVPLIEIALFIQVGGFIGLWPTLAIVILTALLGTLLVRSQGLRALNDLRGSMNELRDPTEPLAHGAMILFSAALLLTPGFFTDAIGFALLIAPVRQAILSYLRAKVKTAQFEMHQRRDRAEHPDIIDGDFTEVTEPGSKPGEKGASGWTQQ